MSLVRGLFDRLVLIAGVLVGGCIPGFIAQYMQRVGGRLDQVRQDLLPFEEIARRYHGGDINALVTHHLSSPDQSFQAEGSAIQGMLDSLARLQAMMDGLTGSAWHQIAYLVGHFDREIGMATWHSYVPSFSLDPAALMVAGAVGVAFWLLFMGTWFGVSKLADLIVIRFFQSSRY
jgi:phytoene dehydrogenase-like protein